MFRTTPTIAYVLSAIIALLSLIEAGGGLFMNNLYRDNDLVTTQLVGNDLVSLVVAVPVLLGALLLSIRGSERAQLVWLGMLDYMLYNYAFYLFGAAFNRFFLIYVALFTLSILALIFALVNINISGFSQKFRVRTPVRWISGYMCIWAVALGGLWIGQSLSFVVTGKVPQVIVDVAHPTSVVFALDLSLLVPFLLLGAFWLWQRRSWGYLLGVILNIKGAVYALALTSMAIFAAKDGVPGASSLIPIWLLFTAASLTASLFLLINLVSPNR